VVWETGLGGRYDSTNVVRPLVAAITNVGLDHMDVLGHKIRQIAYDKSGIIKTGIPVVTAAEGEALDVVQSVARAEKAPLWIRGVHFAEIPSLAGGQQRMHYRGLYRDMWDIPVGLYGRHQLTNAAVALAVYELACAEGGYQRLSDAEIRAAMQTVQWPGRFEIFERNGGVVILDGAHNADGARQMVQSLQRFAAERGIPGDQWTMVLGVLRDKDVRALLRIGLPLAKRVIVTAPAVARAKKPEELAKDIRKDCEWLRPDLEVAIAETVEQALEQATATSPWVCCWGSLYTVHEARQAIKEMEDAKK
jgi:dihydrofolate synthase/folylpolyglutamate synthase